MARPSKLGHVVYSVSEALQLVLFIRCSELVLSTYGKYGYFWPVIRASPSHKDCPGSSLHMTTTPLVLDPLVASHYTGLFVVVAVLFVDTNLPADLASSKQRRVDIGVT